MADLSIVIVNWNTREFLETCLHTVYAATERLALEVFVVDNHSTDGSVEMVREKFPQVRLFQNNVNVGFAAANNQVLPLCSAEYVLLLNPDTRVLGNALDVLVDFMEAHPEAGAVGPKVVHPHMRLQVLSCGYQPTIRTLFNHYFGLSALFPQVPLFRGLNLRAGAHDDQVREVEWISGACLLVRAAVIRQIGPLSEEWFMYAEDMEWCYRMLVRGWKLYHVPEAVVEHHLGASTDQNKPVSAMWVHSLRSYFVRRDHPSRWRTLLFDSILISGLAIRAALYAGRGLVGGTNRSLWRTEARKFITYTKAALAAARGVHM